MSVNRQLTIDFKVRKSSRNTNKVKINYNEKELEKCVNNDLNCDYEKPIVEKSLERKRSRVRKQTNSGNKVDENDKQLSSSPNKVKKSSNGDDLTVYAKTKQLLSPSLMDTIVGRNEEMDDILEAIKRHLSDEKPMSYYISGPAGTGKTLTVNHVIKQLENKFDFKLININCMTFTNTNSIFNKILKELNSKQIQSKDNCLEEIKKRLTEPKDKQMVVVILDEIDRLESKNQQILNNIFLWPQLTNSRLILIGIANALDFTSRILSRLGLKDIKELHFCPYNKEQIIAIIEDRLKRATNDRNIVISVPALQLVARKIASVSGDIRKALDVCRRAVDVIENKDKLSVTPLKLTNDDKLNPKSPVKTNLNNCVDIQQIMAVINKVYGLMSEENSNNWLPLHQQVLLCALLVLNKVKKVKEVKLSQCHDIFVNICTKRGISYNGKNESEFVSMCQQLEDHGLLSVKNVSQTVRNAKLSLKVDESEIEHHLSDKTLLRSILEQSNSYGIK